MSLADKVQIVKTHIKLIFPNLTIFTSRVAVVCPDTGRLVAVRIGIFGLVRVQAAIRAVCQHVESLLDICRHRVCLYPAGVVADDAGVRKSAPDSDLSQNLLLKSRIRR